MTTIETLGAPPVLDEPTPEEGAATEPERLAIMEAHRAAVLARRAELDEALDIIDLKISVYGGSVGSSGSCG